jgi:peptide/nickel transport system permease protein
MATAAAEVRSSRSEGINPLVKPEGQWEIVFRRFRKHKLAVVSAILLGTILITSLMAPLIATFGRDEIDITSRFAPMMSTDQATGRIHLLGTTETGKDVFTLLLYGARVTLTTAVFVALFSTILGVAIGALAGYYRGIIDTLLMRFLEFMSSIPTFPILLILSNILITDPKLLPFPDWFVKPIQSIMLLRTEQEARQVSILLLVLTSFGWIGIARLMRGMVLSIREQEYVQASRSLGTGDPRIILRHVIPNGLAPVIVAFTQQLAGAFATETVLSFLGFGLQDPIPTWGNLLAFGESFIFEQPGFLLKVGVPVVLCSLAFNFIGDGLRDALDPRLKM